MIKIIILLLFTLILSSCEIAPQNPCPELPYYPNATKLRSFDKDSSKRISIYETSDQPDKILSYYATELNAKDWKQNILDKDGLEFVYRDRTEFPVVMDVVIDSVTSKRVQYTTYLMLSSPSGNFKTTCTMLWP